MFLRSDKLAIGVLRCVPGLLFGMLLAAHGNVASAATPAYPTEGEGLVFKPEDDGSVILVGRVEPGQWAELLAAVAD